MKKKVYQHIGAAKVGRSVFNLSYEKKLTCDMGQLIPVMCDEVIPGDIITIGNQCVIRFQPLVAPVLHEINVYYHVFFVPYRLLWPDDGTDGWERFITGDVDGDNASTLPRWTPTTYDAGSLWDYLGFPVDITPGSSCTAKISFLIPPSTAESVVTKSSFNNGLAVNFLPRCQ